MYYNVLQYLEESAERYPQKTALADERESVTYREYLTAARRLGCAVSARLNGAVNRPVAVLIDRNVRSVLAFMGVLYSGNFYVPLDAAMPQDRVSLILDTLRPALVVDARSAGAPFAGALGLDGMLEPAAGDDALLDRVRRGAIDTDPVYAMFTSGSTGVPKGVVVSHRSVIDLAEAFQEAFSFDAGLVFGNQAPFDFDMSVKDLYNALRCGATVQILPKRLFKTPKLLLEYLGDRGIDTLIWAVSALRIVSDFKTFAAAEAPALKYVMFSGEAMPARVLDDWMEHVPGARYVNLYGPTEITCNCAYYEVGRRFSPGERIPVGRAFVNSRVLLMDGQHREILEPDRPGEICVAGTGLALGYWNDPERTDAAFIQNPELPLRGARLYATGDIGCYDGEGNLVFLSRKDHQIKHMGHRIELGEIETALDALPLLDAACCLYDGKAERIVCFYQAERDCKREIVRHLSQKLPKYMWPGVYVRYDALPLNKNGKIDRAELAGRIT